MTPTLQKKMEELAKSFVESDECEVMDLCRAHEDTFKAGFQSAHTLMKAREQKLIENLKNIIHFNDQDMRNAMIDILTSLEADENGGEVG